MTDVAQHATTARQAMPNPLWPTIDYAVPFAEELQTVSMQLN
jgi:hypothetical protein